LHVFLQRVHVQTEKTVILVKTDLTDWRTIVDSNACSKSGICFACKPYFTGSKCGSCIDGRYGTNCSLQCSLGCAGKVCKSRDGTCNCRNYFSGDKCDSCVDGNYGENCSLKCSQGCEENTCNFRDGTCNCSTNYSGEQCEDCIRDRYGEGCSKTCSLGCVENTCSSADGKCDCKYFYKGYKCDVCEDGDHCLNNIESRHPNNTNNFPTGALTGGVIGAVVVFDAAVVIAVLCRRRLSQRKAQGHTDEQNTTHPGGELTQPGQYETLNNSRMEENQRRETYTRLVTTSQDEITERVSPDSIES
ncbi:TIE1-like protein, partial [Mya arenaria]